VDTETIAATDEAIALRVKNGDTSAFAVLFDRYEYKLTRYLSRFLRDAEDACDVLQNTFIKSYEYIQSFDNDKNFSAWIYRIAHNEAINFLKKKKAIPFSLFEIDTLLPLAIDAQDIETGSERAATKIKLDTVLQSLPPKTREILTLYFYEDFSYKEIADILHIPTNLVGVRLKRAKESVQKIIPKE
jgi:RNA polymerase sigma-70 factor (ECF subfamily)